MTDWFRGWIPDKVYLIDPDLYTKNEESISLPHPKLNLPEHMAWNLEPEEFVYFSPKTASFVSYFTIQEHLRTASLHKINEVG